MSERIKVVSGALGSLEVEPCIYAAGDRRALVWILRNDTTARIGVDFFFGEGDARRRPAARVIADRRPLIYSGSRIDRSPELAARARIHFDAGLCDLWIEPNGERRIVSYAIDRHELDAAVDEARAEIRVRDSTRLALTSGGRVEVLCGDTLHAALPLPLETRPMPAGSETLEYLAARAATREQRALAAWLAEAGTLDAERFAAAAASLREGPGGVVGEGPTLTFTGFGLDDDSLRPRHQAALGELRRLLERAPPWIRTRDLSLTFRVECDDIDRAHERSIRRGAPGCGRLERVAVPLHGIEGIELIGADARSTEERQGPGPRAVSVELEARSFTEVRDGHTFRSRRDPAPMLSSWPGLRERYDFAGEFPALAEAWGLTTVTLPELRDLMRQGAGPLVWLIAPERVDERSEGRRSEWFGRVRSILRRLDRDWPARVEPLRLRRTTGAFGNPMWLALELRAAIRTRGLPRSALGERLPSWAIEAVALCTDAWHPPAGAALVERLAEASSTGGEGIGVALALIERIAELDASDPPPSSARADWIASQRAFREAVDRPALADLVAEFDELIDGVVRLGCTNGAVWPGL